MAGPGLPALSRLSQLRSVGAPLRCHARSHHCGGFPCCEHRLQQSQLVGSVAAACGLEIVGPVLVVHGLTCSAACEILPDQGSSLCPLHWRADSYSLHPKYSLIEITEVSNGSKFTKVSYWGFRDIRPGFSPVGVFVCSECCKSADWTYEAPDTGTSPPGLTCSWRFIILEASCQKEFLPYKEPSVHCWNSGHLLEHRTQQKMFKHSFFICIKILTESRVFVCFCFMEK